MCLKPTIIRTYTFDVERSHPHLCVCVYIFIYLFDATALGKEEAELISFILTLRRCSNLFDSLAGERDGENGDDGDEKQNG